MKVLLSKNVNGPEVSSGEEPANETFVSEYNHMQTRLTVNDLAVVLYDEKNLSRPSVRHRY